MPINERLDGLRGSAFVRLNRLLAGAASPTDVTPIALSVGEPQHPPPAILAETIARHAALWNRYPPVQGTDEFRNAAAEWLSRRFGFPAAAIDPARHVLALSGTKEGLYLIAEVAIPDRKNGEQPVVLMPNPFYQVYQGAAVMSGAEIFPLAAAARTGFLPDPEAVPTRILRRTALVFLCNPSNPQGAIGDIDYLRRWLVLAHAHDFIVVVDECYSEIFDTAPPPGALQAGILEGGFDRLLVFHSLSKRSNAAGLRAGFIAGDPALIERFQILRSYCGPQIPLPLQAAAAALWRDEAHVEENRRLYRAKIDLAQSRLGGRFGFYRPPGGFFLWLDVGDGEAACLRLWREAAIRSLPGAYLTLPDADGGDPGRAFLRLALVHDDVILSEALDRVSRVLA